jgi:hypothetical protein
VRLLVLFLFTLSCHAATYYVATTGNDSTGDGTIGNPWKTLNKGATTMGTGDTLNLRGGTYIETNWVNFYVNWKNNSTIQSYAGETATVQQNDANALEVIRVGGTSNNITFNGLILDNSLARTDIAGTTVVKLTDNCHNITFTNCTITSSPRGHGILMNTTGSTVGNHHVVACLFTNVAWDTQGGDSPPHCAYVQSASNIIERSTFDKGNQDFCIHNFDPGALGNIYRQNIIRNSGRGVGLMSPGFCQVYNNLIYSNNSIGIQFNFGTYSNTVANNTIMRLVNGSGISMDNSFGNFIENNIVTEITNGWAYAVGDTVTNTTLRNNLAASNRVYFAGSYIYITTVPGTSTTTNANKFGETFVVGLSSIPTDAHLLSGSDAIGAGRSESFFSTDYDGRTRGAWDIGAFAFNPLITKPIGAATLGFSTW